MAKTGRLAERFILLYFKPPANSHFVFFLLILFTFKGFAQKEILLPGRINSIYEEYSGMAISNGRLYLLPQYGGNKQTKLEQDFFIYSVRLDSVYRAIRDSNGAITSYRTTSVRNLQLLPASIKEQYEGFEAIAIKGDQVFLSMETTDSSKYCYIVWGTFNKTGNEILIDPAKTKQLPRFSFVTNAGFEALSYLPVQKKLLAIGEFNASLYGNKGYELDPSLKKEARAVHIPQAFFRITDIAATGKDLYALNYYWNGDYNSYLNNCMVYANSSVADSIPAIRELLEQMPDYLSAPTSCYTRILKLKNGLNGYWEQVKELETTCSGNNWEGLVVLDNGYLIISDANGSKQLKTTLLYVEK